MSENQSTTAFKQQMLNEYIPRVAEMIDAEEEHMRFLRNQPQSEMIDEFLKISQEILSHLKKRYVEYVAYCVFGNEKQPSPKTNQ
jgi:nitrogenase subunit NifH